MTPERYQQIDHIFQAALALEPQQRAAFLDEACGGDEGLRTEVASLITSDEGGLSFIDEPAFEMAARVLATDEPALKAGDQIDRYEVVSLLGCGGMGEVYLAHDENLDRKIALKLLPSHFNFNDERLRRFQREARAASALNHPNIIIIHEIGQAGNRHFITTEFVDGETLRQRMKCGPMSLNESLGIAIQVCSALAAAHKAGIVHRDIKPENIMLRTDGYVKVLDFGLAKLTEEREQPAKVDATSKSDVSSGLVMGTVKYMSPEQARGQQVDPRSDIFSLGIVLYEMVTGHAPFKGEDANQLVRSILKDEPRRLGEYTSEAPEQLQRIVSKALIKNNTKRYQAAEELLVDLKTLRQQVELSADSLRTIPRADRGTVSTQDHGVRTASSVEYFVSQIKEHRSTTAVGLISLVILLAGIGYSLKSSVSKRGTLPFQQRDWVLITSFDNRTGETLFDGTIESALERELSNSQFVNVVTPERAADSLRLMKKPAETKIDAVLGREICLRDGAIRALVTGRIEKLGSSYVMSVSLVDPTGNQIVASTSEEAANSQTVWPALRRLSNWTRKTLGESLQSIQQSSAALEKVTTPSLPALQLYTQAMAIVNEGSRIQAGSAVQILQQALAEDPQFASAHIMLAFTLRMAGKPEQEWGPPSQRALDLSGRTSERERYFIEGSYYSLREQREKAVSAYEALVRQYPDHFWGHNNLGWTYFSLGRYEECLDQFVAAAELRPNDLRANRQAAWGLIQRDMNEARRVVDRAARAITPEMTTTLPDEVTWIQLFPVHDFWVRGDIESGLKELDRWAQTIESHAGPEREVLIRNIGNCYLAFGKLKAAAAIFQRLPESSQRGPLAEVALVAGNRTEFRRLLSKAKPNLGNAFLLAREGLTNKARKILSERMKSPGAKSVTSQVLLKIIQAEIALSQGRTTEAIALLEESVPLVRWNSSWHFFIESDSLASIFEQRRDLPKAIQVLETASQKKSIAYENTGSTGHHWLRVQWRLAQLYRKSGRVEDAQKLEAELLKTLAYADEDHPILLQLNQARTRNH